MEISLREARESIYWIRLCQELELASQAELRALKGEGEQIARILGAIVISTKRRMTPGPAVFAFCILHFAFCINGIVSPSS